MIKSWGFESFHAAHDLHQDQADYPEKMIDYFNFHLDLWVRAEELGYDGVFLSEHHFGLGFSPSPNLLLPLIAQRTKKLRLGVMGMVVPYHNAWRLVEEVGMLDVLTGGRLEVGTSAGIPSEFARIGMSTEEARARYDEALEIMDAGLRDNVISHQGRFWNFENLTLVPRPIQRPRPPMWTTVVSVESARKAARRGSKITTGFVPTDKAREIFDAYNEEAAKVGNPTGPEQLALRRQVIIDTDEAASAQRSDQFSSQFRSMLENNDKRVITAGRQALDQPGTHGYRLGDDEFISGTPAHVAEQTIEQCRRCGAGHFQVIFAGQHSLEELARDWQLFGNHVIPELRKA
jgi:alkanesulfonate monooxygenase SsuD/methylene tetrahydromethanopterin reductase-like flavin-dependent oxidoreductase (luciferase family)